MNNIEYIKAGFHLAYLKTINRIFVYILARKNPDVIELQWARWMGKNIKLKMLDRGKK